MKRAILLAIGVGVVTSGTIMADPVITSFQGNGELAWTNAVNPNAAYFPWPSSGGNYTNYLTPQVADTSLRFLRVLSA